jgi:predicted nuclease of predicted toxin-antitoxin system
MSADTDFGWLLSKWEHNKPSLILFRKGSDRDPYKQIELIKINLSDQLQELIESGSIIVFESTRIRIRELPIRKK